MKQASRITAIEQIVVCLAVMSAANAAHAAVFASDNASDPAYASEAGGAWKGAYPPPNNPIKDSGQNPPGTDNGGSGFGIWSFSGGYNGNDAPGDPGWPYPPYGRLNHFIDGVDFPTSVYNNLGAPAFGLGGYNGFYLNNPSNGTNYAQPQAMRPFAQPLAIGQKFSADIDTPAAYEGVSPGTFPFAIIRFLNAAGDATLVLSAGDGGGGPFNWAYEDASGKVGLGIPPTATSDGSSISLLRTGAGTGQLTLDGVSANVSFSAGTPAAIRFLTFELTAEGTMGNPTGEHAFFFNNLRIQPGIAGDFDADLDVDGQDLTQWKDDFGVNGDSDADGDSDSDGADFLAWQQKFGAAPGSFSASADIPEPATLLLTLACVLLARRRHCPQPIMSSRVEFEQSMELST